MPLIYQKLACAESPSIAPIMARREQGLPLPRENEEKDEVFWYRLTGEKPIAGGHADKLPTGPCTSILLRKGPGSLGDVWNRVQSQALNTASEGCQLEVLASKCVSKLISERSEPICRQHSIWTQRPEALKSCVGSTASTLKGLFID